MDRVTRKHFFLLAGVLAVAIAAVSPASTADGFAPPREIERGAGLSSQIVGGSEAGTLAPNWPFIVSLWEYPGDGNWYFLCGGSLIKPRWVVTAAHCMGSEAGVPYQPDAVAGGYTNLLDGELISVTKIIQHPDFVPATSENDIMLLKIASSPPGATPAAGSTALADDPADGATVKIAGWGNTTSGGGGTNDLREADVEVVNGATCDAPYATLYGVAQAVFPSMVCAAHLSAPSTYSRDACQGDSGGPLAYNGEIVGIVSFGEGCAQYPYAGVYTRFSSFTDWITQTSSRLLDFTDPSPVFAPAVPGGPGTLGAVSIVNRGGDDLTISSVGVSGDGFSRQGNLCETTLQPGQSCTAYLVFAPTHAGGSTGALTIISDAENGTVRSIPLSGTGTAPAALKLRLRRGSIGTKHAASRRSVSVSFSIDFKFVNPADATLVGNGCRRATAARLKIRGIGALTARGGLVAAGANCIATFSLVVPRRAIGRKAIVTYGFPGSHYFAPATLKKSFRIKPPKSR